MQKEDLTAGQDLRYARLTRRQTPLVILPVFHARRRLIPFPVFQQIDCEEYIEGLSSHLRMFGVTEAGHSVLAQIEGFQPYFYIPAPRGFQSSDLIPFFEHLKVVSRYQNKSL